jgi:cell division septal protein FtsQ
VDVDRKLPGTLVVYVTERVPVALVPASGGLRVYDARGVALPIDPTRVEVNVPIMAQRDTALLRLLGAVRAGMPALYARVSEVKRTGRDELVLRLKTGNIRVMQDVTLDRLAEIDPVEEDLARRNIQVTEIDLRFRDQVIARLQ